MLVSVIYNNTRGKQSASIAFHPNGACYAGKDLNDFKSAIFCSSISMVLVIKIMGLIPKEYMN